MSKLVLYINDEYLTEIGVAIPSCKNLNFNDRCKAREKYIALKVSEFKMQHVNLLLTGNFNFKIFLLI